MKNSRLMNKKTQCLEYIKRWYLGQEILAVRMYGGDDVTEYCMQAMMIELLRELVDRPPPEFPDGSPMLEKWVDAEYKTITKRLGVDFGFLEPQIFSIKNLAWNYFIDGIERVHAYPEYNSRIYKIQRQETMH